MTERPRSRTREDMYENLRGDLSAGVSGCHGSFGCTGLDHATLALFEAMSEVSEERIFAAWEDGNGLTIWRWLQTGEMTMHAGVELADIEHLRLKIIALANASGMWWADYEYAVPLSDWAAKHGPAPRIGERSASDG